MRKSFLLLFAAAVLMPGFAQAQRYEVTPFLGGAIGGETNARFLPATAATPSPFSNVNRLTVSNGFTWGIAAGAFINDETEVEFMWGRQSTDAVGTKTGSPAPQTPDTKLFNLTT